MATAATDTKKKRPRVFLDIDIGDPDEHARQAAAHARFLAFWREDGVKIYGAPPPPAELDAALRETLLEAYASSAPRAATEAGDARAEPPDSLRAGRLVCELYADEAPKAVQNFLALVRGSATSKAQKKPLCYKGVRFHRVVRGFVAQAGVMNERLGTGESSFPGNAPFQDDKAALKLKHDGVGVLSMANAGKPHTNTSQFFFTLSEKGAPALDGRHVVFGRVVEGAGVLARIDAEAGAADGEPPRAVVAIADCGEVS
jgi:cyclophilin family peptidyl-prolyl cis-trans isomerase